LATEPPYKEGLVPKVRYWLCGSNPGGLLGVGALIVINFPCLITSFKSPRNLFHTIISSLILATTIQEREWVLFLP
jgi:hypothetical protein